MRHALTLGLALWGAPATAASYDPELTWRTLQTPHFEITFHGGEEQLAQETADLAEQIWAEMSAELAWSPRLRTQVVLVDHTDIANGYATTLPVNTIVIFVTAPQEGSSLSLYEGWIDTILTHEYTHILHIDTVEGLPLLLRGVLGRIVTVNRVSPGWIIEGQATFQETRHTNAGRGRAPAADTVKRMAVLEDAFPPLGNLDGWQRAPPGGNLRYLFGQDFQQYVADHTGEDAWTDFIHLYGGGIPYLLPSRRAFGKTLGALYRDWKAEMTARYQAQAAAIQAEAPLTPFRLLSDGTDQCAGPAFSPDGHRLVWSCSDPSTGAGIYLARGDGSNPEEEMEDRFATDFTWRADSEAFVFSGTHVVNRFNLYTDVNLHVLGGSTRSLTQGKRARNPALSPDGTELLVVTNRAQNNQLARLTVDQRLEHLTDYTDHTQLSTPAFSPDGRHVALSVWRDGRRDLWIYDADGAPARRVTADTAEDLDPSWSPDGRTLYFASARSGVFNIYAVDLKTERLWQVTNLLGGALHPTVNADETALVFESYSNNGIDIAWMDLDRSAWIDRGLLPAPDLMGVPLADIRPATDWSPPAPGPEPNWDAAEEPTRKEERQQRRADRKASRAVPTALVETPAYPGLTGLGGPYEIAARAPGRWGLPGEGPETGHRPQTAWDAPQRAPDQREDAKVEQDAPEESDYAFTWPVARYNPWKTLPPRYVIPGIYSTSYGYMGTLATGGADTLRQYLYSGWVSYRTDSQFLGWGASFALNRFIPLYTAGAYTYTVPYGDVFVETSPPTDGGGWIPSVEDTGDRYWDKRLLGYAQVTWARSQYQSVFARWSGSLRQPLDELDPATYTPYLPTRGFLSSIGGGWRLARGKSYSLSISPEDARILSAVGELYSPLFGSYVLDDLNQPQPFTQLQITGEWREYMAVPWGANHVIAWKLAGGASGGDSQRYGSYRLGGSFGEAAYYTLPDEWRALRGFAPATVYGDWFYLGSVEYRLPLAVIDRGLGALPLFVRSLSASPFVDFGHAFAGPDELSTALPATRVGAGAELRLTMVVGWGIGLSVRSGYAFAVRGSGGYAPGSTDGFYTWLGTSF